MKRSISYKKAQGWDTFIKIIVPIVIVILIILWASGAFTKTKAFGEKCTSANPIFDYKCANEIDIKLTKCQAGWSTDLAKECPKQNDAKVECCYREKP